LLDADVVPTNYGDQADVDGGTVTWTITGATCTRPGGAALTANVLNGQAALNDVTCPAGTNYTVTATYSGYSTYAASSDTTGDDLDVN
jgi:hypothetical protein